MNFVRRYYGLIGLILVFILSIFSILPLFHPGFFPIHDNTQVQRVYEMAASLKIGLFPVRWVPDLGYGLGYPIFNFYAPFAYYLGAIFMFLGFDALIATKIMIGLGVLASGFSMYFLAKEFWGETGGLLSALIYVYFPYHAVNIYVRGAISEAWAYAFIPLAFFGFYKLFEKSKYFYLATSVIGFSGLILSHNLTAMMVTPYLIVFLLILIVYSYKNKRNKNTFYLIFAFSLALLVSAFYWLPAILEINNTKVPLMIKYESNFREHFVCLSQLWYSQWGFGGSVKGCNDGMSFMVGKVNILILIFSLVSFILALIFAKKISKKILSTYLLSLAGLILSIFLMLQQSSIIWEMFLPMQYLQYPWRYLNLVGFFWAFASGSLLFFSEKLIKNKILLFLEFLILLLLIVAINRMFFLPQIYLNKTANDYTNEISLKWTTSKISDEYLPQNIERPKNINYALQNKRIPFKETVAERVANIISFFGILVLILGIILKKRGKNE